MTAPLVDVLARVLAEYGIENPTFRAHVAAEQARAVGEWLTSDEAVEGACRRYIRSPWDEAGDADREGSRRVMRAVIAAVRDYGLGGAS